MRRRGRECALQMLYQLDVAKELEGPIAPVRVEEAIAAFWASFEETPDDDREFAERLVRGILGDLQGLDTSIEKVSHHWRMTRMEKVDKNVIRVAAYEILRCPDIPRAASINEAIEIAKKFSGKEAAAFVNGVLDHLDKAADNADERTKTNHGRGPV